MKCALLRVNESKPPNYFRIMTDSVSVICICICLSVMTQVVFTNKALEWSSEVM